MIKKVLLTTTVGLLGPVYCVGMLSAQECRCPVPTARAKVIVHLPADARLQIDNFLSQQTSATRTFYTPELGMGASHFYLMKASFARGGKEVVVTRKIGVRAGDSIHVYLEGDGEEESENGLEKPRRPDMTPIPDSLPSLKPPPAKRD